MKAHWRWILPSSVGVVLVVVVSIVLTTQSSGNAACTKPVAYLESGSASYYTASRGGECGFGPPTSDAYVALGTAEYAGGSACGEYLDVTGPGGVTRVEVVDECPSCPRGKIDLSRAAFSRIGSTSAGIIAVSYDVAADPQPATPMRVKVKGGTAYSALAVVIDGHGDRLSTVELQTAGGFVPMSRGSDNFWTGPAGAVASPFTIRVTDMYGHQVTVGGLATGASAFQQTAVALYGAPTPAPSVEASPSLSPSVEASSAAPPVASPSVVPAAKKC